ncbi:MAG: LapA family protein [Deltaproteobacteria bacterium]|nr:MAG: LapA family protein [Deltaproteobacteria bacterium]
MRLRRIIFLLLGLLFATFVVQNADVVQVRFLFWSAYASRALALLRAFVLGIIVGWVAGLVNRKEISSAATFGK